MSTQPAAGLHDPVDQSVYQRLLSQRIVVLGSEVREDNANSIAAQMLLLAADDPTRDIFLYINSPGGSVDAGMAVYDTMQYIEPDVGTVVMGMAASMAQVLACAGAPGKRYALPHSRIMMHQPSGGMGGTAADIAIQAQQLTHMKGLISEVIARHTGQDVATILADADRDRWFTAEQAQAYGMVDRVVARARDVRGLPVPV